MIESKPVTVLRGVGESLAARLRALGVETTQDLLFLLPMRYEDRTRIVPLGELRPGQRASVEGEVLLTLGELQDDMNDYPAAVPTLERALHAATAGNSLRVAAEYNPMPGKFRDNDLIDRGGGAGRVSRKHVRSDGRHDFPEPTGRGVVRLDGLS